MLQKVPVEIWLTPQYLLISRNHSPSSEKWHLLLLSHDLERSLNCNQLLIYKEVLVQPNVFNTRSQWNNHGLFTHWDTFQMENNSWHHGTNWDKYCSTLCLVCEFSHCWVWIIEAYSQNLKHPYLIRVISGPYGLN